MSTLFISDLHLDENRPDITRAFLSFMNTHASKAEALYILGDFFEAWIGDDEDTPLQQEVKAALSQCQTPIFIMHGNRDFLIGEQFCQQTGAQLMDDPGIIDLYGKRVLLMHGDSLCTEDYAYMKFRQNMRNPQWQKLFLARPLEDRRKTAAQLRALSQAQNQGKQEEIMDVTQAEVLRVMQEYEVDTLIHGHTHRPKVHSIDFQRNAEQGTALKGKRVVLGDWDHSVWYLEYHSNHQFDLQHIDTSNYLDDVNR